MESKWIIVWYYVLFVDAIEKVPMVCMASNGLTSWQRDAVEGESARVTLSERYWQCIPLITSTGPKELRFCIYPCSYIPVEATSERTVALISNMKQLLLIYKVPDVCTKQNICPCTS